MNILIVIGEPALGQAWCRHFRALGHRVAVTNDPLEIQTALGTGCFDVALFDTLLARGSSLAYADIAVEAAPDIALIFVTRTAHFSDGSIFGHSPNVRAFLNTDTPLEDLTAVVEHYGRGGHAYGIGA